LFVSNNKLFDVYKCEEELDLRTGVEATNYISHINWLHR